MVAPYQPLTNSPNETIAAYIYFDGRQKEEVATLLRRGEETWVNSRWVSVPDSEGGGLAEREFLFREVGLERWLNGLDLEGKDAAAKIERRRQKIEKRRQNRNSTGDMQMEGKSKADKGIMRYGNDALEDVSDDEVSSDSDDDPIPESAGQIKVALYRVLASGEIKRGEYSPQFDAHDDDDETAGNGGDAGADIDHTTSFAKPKSLDPKSISTQTVTGIDPTDKPYATFTFMYRGSRKFYCRCSNLFFFFLIFSGLYHYFAVTEVAKAMFTDQPPGQLQKMGILKDPKAQETPGSAKRRSLQPDFSNLGPLKPGGTVGFLNFRDNNQEKRKSKKNKKAQKNDDDMDSDDDEDDSILGKADDEEAKEDNHHLSPDDSRFGGELAEGVRKIKVRIYDMYAFYYFQLLMEIQLKRQHSAASLSGSNKADATDTTASGETKQSSSNLSTSVPNASATATSAADLFKPAMNVANGESAGSPLKKQRASVSGSDENAIRKRIGSGLSTNITDALGSSGAADTTGFGTISTLFGGSLKPPEPGPQQVPSQPQDEEEL